MTHFFNQSISVFSRNPATGALTQLPGTSGWVSQNGEGVFEVPATAGQCADGAFIGQVDGIVVSPDGENVYVGSLSNAVLAFSRSQVDGAMTQLAATTGGDEDAAESDEDDDDTAAGPAGDDPGVAGDSAGDDGGSLAFTGFTCFSS